MDPMKNPFVPGAGLPPPELAGRDELLRDIRIACNRAALGVPVRSFMLVGLRGVGKTVLLNRAAEEAEEDGMIVSLVEAPENKGLPELLLKEMGRVLRRLSFAEAAADAVGRGVGALRNFAAGFHLTWEGWEIGIDPVAELGVADSGDLEEDFSEMVRLIGLAAKKAKKAWVLLIDEVQYLKEEDLAALIVALHKTGQKGLPVVFVGAGLPQITRLAGEAKSYSERLFDWRRLEALPDEAARRAVAVPLRSRGAEIEDEALTELIRGAHGYPFFIQAWAYRTWESAEGPVITLPDVRSAYGRTLSGLDEGFFQLRADRLTEAETAYVRAMAEGGDGPYAVGEIAGRMGRRANDVTALRDKLIGKGMIYSPRRGFLDFSVPLFADYVRRHAESNR